MSKGIGGHQRAFRGKTNEWLTPPNIITALGEFDLDPCSPVVRPWDTAKKHYHIEDDGLAQKWEGRVWLNPPYGNEAEDWLKRLAEHGNGIALIFARTETAMFFDWCWNKANSMLFLKGRLFFHTVDGARAKHNGGAPSVLIAYGASNTAALEASKIEGQMVYLRN